MEQTKCIAGECYHVYNRGVDKRQIFLDEKDHFRFIHDIYEFNDEEPAKNSGYYASCSCRNVFSLQERKPRKLLVDILAFVLMPNHFHFLLIPRRDSGVTEFMKKLGTGYANYFNQKYQRSGSLFEGPYKNVAVKKHEHLLHLPFYIHANPLNIAFPEWKEKILKKDADSALKFLKDYRWSSFLDYCGIKNFPSLTNREFLRKFYGEGQKNSEDKNFYQNMFFDWLVDHGDVFSTVRELKNPIK